MSTSLSFPDMNISCLNSITAIKTYGRIRIWTHTHTLDMISRPNFSTVCHFRHFFVPDIFLQPQSPGFIYLTGCIFCFGFHGWLL